MSSLTVDAGWSFERREGDERARRQPLQNNALNGRGVHFVTINDSLAKRDAEWMGEIYRCLGRSVGSIVPDTVGEFDWYDGAAGIRADTARWPGVADVSVGAQGYY